MFKSCFWFINLFIHAMHARKSSISHCHVWQKKIIRDSLQYTVWQFVFFFFVSSRKFNTLLQWDQFEQTLPYSILLINWIRARRSCTQHKRWTVTVTIQVQWTITFFATTSFTLLFHHHSSPFSTSILKPKWKKERKQKFCLVQQQTKLVLCIPYHTCSTRLGRPVFCDNCFKSFASGLWLIEKYDFIVLSWWCLNDVRIRFALDEALMWLPRPKPRSR